METVYTGCAKKTGTIFCARYNFTKYLLIFKIFSLSGSDKKL